MSFNYFILTIPHADFTPYLPPQCNYLKGQLELAASGFLHWQVIVGLIKKSRITAVKKIFGDSAHIEPTRSSAADSYVWKDDTAVVGTRFELGSKLLNRNNPKDWDVILGDAKAGRVGNIPSDVVIRCYNSIKRIGVDYCQPSAIERTVVCYWGPTGVGKSRLAWHEAGILAYPKDPLSKFWDGYRGQENVVIDEFRGTVSISHLLRWFDRYPVLVEVKGSSVVFNARKIWITSNLSPRHWYPELDEPTLAALLRRINVIHVPFALGESRFENSDPQIETDSGSVYPELDAVK